MSTKARTRRSFLPILEALFLGLSIARVVDVASVASAQGATGNVPASAAREQSVLGPGLYVFQTRIDHATCGDADRTGDVTSYYAAIDGIPGSREMRMSLLNSRFWPTWTLAITESDHVIGDAQQDGVTGPTRGLSHFDVALDHGSFKGRGTREYSRVVGTESVRCRVSYDALLRRIDR